MTTMSYLGTATPELTDSQIEAVFANLDAEFNSMMLDAFSHGMYTGVVVVTLWVVASRNDFRDLRRQILVLTILILYILTTIGLYCQWANANLSFLTDGENFWTAFSATPSTSMELTIGIIAIVSTVVADATLIWRCWIVWGRPWLIVLIPIACTAVAIASRGIVTYNYAFGSNPSPRALFLEKIVSWSTLYSSLILATLVWCTILIIYRIWRVGGAAGRLHAYQKVIEMLVESASLYSATIVVLLVLEARNVLAGEYIEEVTTAMRGIMPTILVGRVAAGHARPDDSWNDSTRPRSILRFGHQSVSHNDTEMSVGSGQEETLIAELDLEEGLKDSTEVRGEASAPIVSAYDCYARAVGTPSTVDCSIV
ncbi:hypothetical protein IW261DRAFT_1573349 [Armillaria novae-zelandiae]|uniref:Uncharacterized protein n=1 Tax=Armillaria novae-zelandiae TaxID=153914 RepID=A0AA39NNS5_9AGAR|nr:hypothetical protein IW261DRAFT_1573349 [Armillaria novae-zelandiae]